MELPARVGGPPAAPKGDGDGDRREPAERGEDRETEGDESRRRDERRDPQPSVHAQDIGAGDLFGAGPGRVIFR
jgi:hypothetical protein